MSSASTSGPPPGLPYSGAGPAHGFKSTNGVEIVHDGTLRAVGRVFPHIDDLKAARPDVNPLASIRKLLSEGESYAKQADTQFDFGRLELALQDYMKAAIIAVEIIPRHKDYPDLKSDRGDLHRLWAVLQKRISSRQQRFEEVKDIIKTNNAQSGVKPNLQNGHITRESIDNIHNQPLAVTFHNASEVSQTVRTFPTTNGAVAVPSVLSRNGDPSKIRQKPPIQPKPDALHGKSITPSADRSGQPEINKSEEDLAARFARLRTTNLHSSVAVQDPRIRTRPIGMSTAIKNEKGRGSAITTPAGSDNRPDRPYGPRDMPQPSSGPTKPLKLPLDVDIPPMPKPPDAIYSPARNTNSPLQIDMPQPTPRSMFGAAGRSANAALDTRNSAGRKDFFVPPPSNSNDSSSTVGKLRDSSTVTPEELMGYLKRGSHQLSILLIDIRYRADFDKGHIMCPNIICIDPIVLRKGISAEELAQSLVLSPESEQTLFNERDKFDLIVYYDESSSDVGANSNNYGHETALADFSRAVYDYGYEKRSKQNPMLLVGGLDSWIDLLGPGALRTSINATAPSQPTRKPYGKLPVNRRFPAARRPTYEARPLPKEEEQKWEQTLKEENIESDDTYFVRTTADFVRRFPEPSAIRESMTSPSAANDHAIHLAAARRDELNSMTPRIPARPPPALPRQSYSGVSDRNAGALNAVYKNEDVAPGRDTAGRDTISRPVAQVNRCGLWNFGNTCYMNSIVQVLSNTPEFAQWLLNPEFVRDNRSPRKNTEATDPPQLMAQNLRNLLRHLWSANYQYITPQTLKVCLARPSMVGFFYTDLSRITWRQLRCTTRRYKILEATLNKTHMNFLDFSLIYLRTRRTLGGTFLTPQH
jgi:ubiquitin carboxyl-terminal hydrolase 8